MSAADLCCPVCATELPIEALFADRETRQAFARLAAVVLPLDNKLLAYVSLFAPAKNRMAIGRKVKLLLELLPLIESGEIQRRGRAWQPSHADWINAIDQMLDARNAGKLRLPLTSHGYLFEVLASLADKAEAEQERREEEDRRHGRAVVQAPSPGVPVANAITPVLARLIPAPDPETAARGREIREQLIAERNARRATANPD